MCCTSGYSSNESKQIAKFHFPLKNRDLNQLWIRFVNRKDWIPTKHSVLCELHFEDKFITRGEKCTLKWLMNPVPSIYPAELLESPPALPTPQTTQNLPKKRTFQEDELETFQQNDIVRSLHNKNETFSPPGFQFKRVGNNVLFYNIVFDEQTQFPTILESIKSTQICMYIYNTMGCHFLYHNGSFKDTMLNSIKLVCWKTSLLILKTLQQKTITQF